MTTTRVDLIIIGTGSAAQTVATICRQAGWRIAMGDELPFGGTCALRGCDPKKVLVAVADLVDWSRRMQGKGVSTPALSIRWPDLIGFKHTFTDAVPKQTEHDFREAGIHQWHGHARFVDPTSIRVGQETFVGRHVLIATGARPAPLGIAGEQWLTTSTQFLERETLPQRIVFVGGGYIAFEFAQIAACAGSQVQILHRGPHPLKRFDPDLVAQLVQSLQELGMKVQCKTAVCAIERRENGLFVHSRREDR